MKHEILLLREVAERLRVSPATVNRLLSQRRRGKGHFPLPLSLFKGKGRWLASDVEDYITSLASINATAPAPIKSETQKEKEFAERQKRAQQTLARHGIRKQGTPQPPGNVEPAVQRQKRHATAEFDTET